MIVHNLDVIRCADWVIDLGPEGGNEGGEIIAVGTPEEVAAHPTSHTGRYLKQVLQQHPPEVAAVCGWSWRGRGRAGSGLGGGLLGSEWELWETSRSLVFWLLAGCWGWLGCDRRYSQPKASFHHHNGILYFWRTVYWNPERLRATHLRLKQKPDCACSRGILRLRVKRLRARSNSGISHGRLILLLYQE